jgi:hypothetical protein
LRLLGYRDCGCRQCRRDRQLLAPSSSEDRLHRFDTVLTIYISQYVVMGHAVSRLVVVVSLSLASRNLHRVWPEEYAHLRVSDNVPVMHVSPTVRQKCSSIACLV